MSKEKHRDSIRKNLDAVKRWRWGILFSVTILFSVILFPNLVITKHQYGLGDVAERDIKSPRDFFIEDTAATEKNRRQAVDAVLTVYDYDAGLAAGLIRNVEDVFAKIRSASAAPDKERPQQPAVNTKDGQSASKVQKPIQLEIIDKRKFLEENLSIRVSKGAFIELEKVGFSKEISGTITGILKNTGLSTI